MTQTPAGWHPDPSNGGRLRYWDGLQWTEHFADPQPTQRPMPFHQNGSTPKKKHTGRNILFGVVGLVVLIAIFSSLGGNSNTGNDNTTTTANTATSADDSSPTTATPTPTTPPKPKFTVPQQNAIRQAKQYIDYQGFSRQGLIDQLSSKYGAGFTVANATFAVNHIKVNWNQQAVRAAKAYLDYQGFSRQGLINQLQSSYGAKFTPAQATFAANQVGLR